MHNRLALIVISLVCAFCGRAQDKPPQPVTTTPIAVSQAKSNDLQQEVKQYREHAEMLRKRNSGYYIALSILALLCAAGIIVAGVLDRGKVSAVLGGLITVLIGAQNLFPVRDRAGYYQVLVAETDNLMDDVRYSETPDQFNQALKTLKVLRQRQEPAPGQNALKELLAEVKAGNPDKP